MLLSCSLYASVVKHAVSKGENEGDGDLVTTAHDVWPQAPGP